jgi:hypothetical protein
MASATEEKQPLLNANIRNTNININPNINNNINRGAVPAAAASDRNRHAVRSNVLSNLTSIRFSHISLCLSLTFNLPQIVAIIIILAKHWLPYGCDKPLTFWAIIHGARLVLAMIVSFLPVFSRRVTVQSENYIRVNDTLNMLGFAWFIVGNLWILNSQTCEEKQPQIYYLCLILLTIQYGVMFLPCLLLCLLAPIVFFCLPALIRLSVALQPDRGADASIINALPLLIYSPNMFPVEDNPECAICLAEYEAGEELRQLPCHAKHHFHKNCVDNWLKLNGSCPICRAPIDSSERREEAEQGMFTARSYQSQPPSIDAIV